MTATSALKTATRSPDTQAELIAAGVSLAATVTPQTLRDGISIEEIRAATVRCSRARFWNGEKSNVAA